MTGLPTGVAGSRRTDGARESRRSARHLAGKQKRNHFRAGWPSGMTARRYQPSARCQVHEKAGQRLSLQGGSSAHCWHTRAEALVCDLPCRPAGCCPHVCLARSSQCLRRSRCASTCSAVCCSFCAQNLMAAWQSAHIAMAISRRANSTKQALTQEMPVAAIMSLLAKRPCVDFECVQHSNY